jgi:hypothetical protein
MNINPLAIFTIVQNEPVWLPIWVDYYRTQIGASHLFVLDHDSTGEGADVLSELSTKSGINVVPVHRHVSFDHRWLAHTVQLFQHFLLNSYRAVLFVEVDEIVATTRDSKYRNLEQYAAGVIGSKKLFGKPRKYVRCTGYEIVHKPEEESPLDWSKPLLKQRTWWYHSVLYSKTLLSMTPLEWDKGFHVLSNQKARIEKMEDDLILIHLHKIDFDFCLARHQESARRNWSTSDVEEGAGKQNRISDIEELRTWFRTSIDDPSKEARLVPIPDHMKSII